MILPIANYEDKQDNDLVMNCTFYHDICGNLYMKIFSKYFVLMISATDDIEWIEVINYENLSKIDNNIKYSNIKNTYEKNSLKGKVAKEFEEANDVDDEEIDEDGYYQNKHKIYPEEKLYTTEDTTDTRNTTDATEDIVDSQNTVEDIQDKLENYYKFSKFGNNSTITCLDRSLDVLANYDTFIMNDNTSYVLTTLQAASKSEYRVSLFVSGKILLNVVGTKLNTYDLFYKIKPNKLGNEFIIVCEKIHTKCVI